MDAGAKSPKFSRRARRGALEKFPAKNSEKFPEKFPRIFRKVSGKISAKILPITERKSKNFAPIKIRAAAPGENANRENASACAENPANGEARWKIPQKKTAGKNPTDAKPLAEKSAENPQKKAPAIAEAFTDREPRTAFSP